MKHFFTFLALAFVLGSCLTEDSAKPGKTPTFVRYYNGGYNDQAVALEQTDDGGFIILANSKIQVSEATAPRFRIKLIKTDENGNPTWTSFFPPDDTKSFRSAGLSLIPGGGYVITGQDIQSDSTSKTLLLMVDASGNAIAPSPISVRSPLLRSIEGQAVAVNAAGDFVVLSVSGNANMYLTSFKKSDLSVNWVTNYAAGKTSLSNKLFVETPEKYLWSGTVNKNDIIGVRMVKAAPGAVNTDFDLTYVNPGYEETAVDFTRYGFGYAVIGSTNAKVDASGNKSSGDFDIMFKRLAADGSVLSTKSFPLGEKDTNNDTGNALSSTQDGGLILLASVNSASLKNGRGDDDYLLIKVDAFGNEVWPEKKSFGSRYKDTGVAIRQAADGGYVVLGTTTQGSLDIIMLAKTDKDGNIE